MIDAHGGRGEKAGTAGGLLRAQGADLERAWILRSMLHEAAAPALGQDKTPTGDPPNLVLWGTEEEGG